ncbi:MAG: hypothetical protein AMJ89_01230 [candidate division Zixibacteria bacterium SM23_73]|nr:MAG: hypothetical protein AMJ89_01230 [candidate division Zixibacteria bacterium SM23_73]
MKRKFKHPLIFMKKSLKDGQNLSKYCLFLKSMASDKDFAFFFYLKIFSMDSEFEQSVGF